MFEKLQQIQERLSDRIEGRDIINHRASMIRDLANRQDAKQLLDDVRPLINAVQHPEPELFGKSYHLFGYEDPTKKKPSPEDISKIEDHLAAYLIYTLEKNGSTEHFRVRDDQIQSIVALLRKDHLQSPTGSGKSSVILPIASLVKAISENGLVDVVSASHELTTEVSENIAALNNLLPEHLCIVIEEGEKQEAQNESTATRQKLAKKLIHKIVEGTEDPDIATLQFDSLFGRMPKLKKDQEEINRPRLRIFKDDDYVFWKMRNPSEATSHTYWDEIHVPYDRASPYLVSGEGIPTENSVNNYLFERIVSGVMADQVETWREWGLLEEKKGTRFGVKGGEGGVRFKKNEKRFHDLFEQTLAQAVSASSDETSKLGSKIQQVALGVGVDFLALKKWFAQELNERIKDGELENIVSEHRIALMRAKAIKAGKKYSVKDGRVISRDPYMGISLPGRQYHADILLALQSLNGEVNYFNFIKSAAEMTTFEGFVVNTLKGKVSGLSGTLKVRSLVSEKHEDSPLARFLSKSSRTPTFAAEVPGQRSKTVPTPEYVHEDSKIDSILQDILLSDRKKRRPVAIFALDETEGLTLKNKLTAVYKERLILFVSDDLTEKEAQEKYQMFADSEDAILISTGRAGVGVDIKKSNKTDEPFPDFLTIIDGLPQSRTQMFQILGRRRRTSESDSDDYKWIFDKNDFMGHEGLAQEAQEERKKRTDRFKKLSLDPIANRQDLLKELDLMLRRAEDQQTEDAVVKAGFDDYYQKALGTFTLHGKTIGYGHLMETEKQNVQYGRLEQVLEQNFNPSEVKLLNLLLGQYTKKEDRYDPLRTMFYGYLQAPNSLYYDLKNLLGYSEGQQASARLADFAFKVSGYFDEPEMFEHWLDTRSEEFVEVMKNSLVLLERQLNSEAHISIDDVLSGKAKLIGLEREIAGDGKEEDVGKYKTYYATGTTLALTTYTDIYFGKPMLFVFRPSNSRLPYLYDPLLNDSFLLIGGPLSLVVESNKVPNE